MSFNSSVGILLVHALQDRDNNGNLPAVSIPQSEFFSFTHAEPVETDAGASKFQFLSRNSSRSRSGRSPHHYYTLICACFATFAATRRCFIEQLSSTLGPTLLLGAAFPPWSQLSRSNLPEIFIERFCMAEPTLARSIRQRAKKRSDLAIPRTRARHVVSLRRSFRFC